jgi:hypothetical protein
MGMKHDVTSHMPHAFGLQLDLHANVDQNVGGQIHRQKVSSPSGWQAAHG